MTLNEWKERVKQCAIKDVNLFMVLEILRDWENEVNQRTWNEEWQERVIKEEMELWGSTK
jgi:hypothetical protein